MGASGKINKDIIFFDGVCNLCNGAVNFIIDRDPKHKFQFASLQSAKAKELLPERAFDVDSILLLRNDGQLLKKSSAALEIAKNLSGGWFLLYVFKIVPTFIRDAVYDLIAKNRYKWFGKLDSCRVPTPDLQERFLEAS